jgi:hypothetical protein
MISFSDPHSLHTFLVLAFLDNTKEPANPVNVRKVQTAERIHAEHLDQSFHTRGTEHMRSPVNHMFERSENVG